MPSTNGPDLVPMRPPKGGVSVRMYNVGFGDCFLLAFPGKEKKTFFMLIDCGVHHQYEGGEARIRLAAEDIAGVTGKHLNLVAITHQHTDHILGFKHARPIFADFQIDDLWLAWTENPRDTLAKALLRQYGIQMQALQAAALRLSPARATFLEQLRGIMAFEPDRLAAGEGKLDELGFLRKQSQRKLTSSNDYRRPGEAPLLLPGVDGVEVFVLGPPRDQSLLKKLEAKSELYLDAIGTGEARALAAALSVDLIESATEADREHFINNCPFEEKFRLPRVAAPSSAEYNNFFQRSYGFGGTPADSPAWRRIDDDWLAVTEKLALSINSLTNNTSLVLAIELAKKKVLLFAGDAQVGNWLSWGKIEWQRGGDTAEKITGEDLIRRTALYKVGHHGSRNATLSEHGLEWMDRSDLVAMIPVDEKWANEEKKWEHPDPRLLARVMEKTKGRILRSDEIPYQGPADIPASELKSFMDGVKYDKSEEKLWIEYSMNA